MPSEVKGKGDGDGEKCCVRVTLRAVVCRETRLPSRGDDVTKGYCKGR